jgi:hypothetical protein
MTIPPGPEEIGIREEIDILSGIDPLFLERQRNRYASRGVALIVLRNGIAAIAILVSITHATPATESAERFGDSMMVFGIGAASGLASAFFAYLSRTFRLERPIFNNWRRPLRWLAVAAAVAGTACFLIGLNISRLAVVPEEAHHSAPAAGTAPSTGTTAPSTGTAPAR